MIAYFNEQAIKNGLPGIYFTAVKNHSYHSHEFLKPYSAVMKFQPREAYSSKAFLKPKHCFATSNTQKATSHYSIIFN